LVKNNLDTWVLNSKGLALNDLGRNDDAIQLYEQTLQIDPKNITALVNKANSLNNLLNYLEAVAFYDLAQSIDPNIKGISLTKSKIFEKLGKQDEAYLAAQGLLIKDMKKIISAAKQNHIGVAHQYCENRFYELENK